MEILDSRVWRDGWDINKYFIYPALCGSNLLFPLLEDTLRPTHWKFALIAAYCSANPQCSIFGEALHVFWVGGGIEGYTCFATVTCLSCTFGFGT